MQCGTIGVRRPRARDLDERFEIGHFLKVTRSYWPGLFHCYDVADLPRTNNDLERVISHVGGYL